MTSHHTIKKKPTHIKYEIDTGIDIISTQNDNYYMTILKKNGKDIGEFRVGISPPHDLGIHIEEEYKSKGFSKLLIKEMCKKLERILPEDTFLYIDTDASWEPDSKGILKSYWDYLGMEETPEEDPYYGYEKRIRLGDLCKKVSGGRKNKTKKTRKHKKRRKTRKRKL